MELYPIWQISNCLVNGKTNDDGAFFKAALLSGPPDIGNNPFLFTYSSDALWFFPLNLGKTTTGRQRAELRFGADERIGYEEQEASKRARNWTLIAAVALHIRACVFILKVAASHCTPVLVMDEVDGMARGGMQELDS